MRRDIFIAILAGALSTSSVFAGEPSGQSATVVQLAQTGTASMRQMSYADLERLYLDGKISAKEYQKLLADIKSRPQIAPPPARQALPPANTAPKSSANIIAPKTNRPPVTATATNQQDKI